MIKRALLIIALLPGIACATQQNLIYQAGGPSSPWKIEGKKVQENTTDLYTNKANKASTVMLWSEWANGASFTTSSPPVVYNGSIYKCIAPYTKNAGEYPDTQTDYFAEVTGGGGVVDLSNYLSKTNTTAFTPTTDYHPATKKYVDDSITAGGGYTDEQAQDAAGGMFTGNTETGITVTYDDNTGKVNFVVATQSDVNFTSTLNTKLAGIATGAEVNVNADWNSSSGDSQILNKPTIPTVSDTAYGSGWNGDTGAASKNAIYDKIETLSGSSLPAWLPATGPTDGRQILQATGGCSNATYSTQSTCEAASATWTTPGYVNTSIINGLINDAGTADDDLWSAAKITSELAGKQNTLIAGTDYLTPAAAASTYQTDLSVPDQAEAEAGTSTTERVWTAKRIAQAISARAGGGTVTAITSEPYSDVACTGAKYDTVANRFYPCIGGYHTAYLSGTAFSNASPATYTLTIDGTGWDGTDSVSVSGSTYTANGTKTDLSGSNSVTVTPNTGRTAAVSGTCISSLETAYTALMVENCTMSVTFSTVSAGNSDTFDGTDSTLLTTHNSSWVTLPGTSFIASRLEISDNAITTTNGYVGGGAFYNSSSSDISQIVFKGQSTVENSIKRVTVRAGSDTLGYAGDIYGASSGNWTISTIYKNGAQIGSDCTGLSIPISSDHTARIVASGTSTVTVTLYIDDVQVCQRSDTSSAIASGHPGFYVSGAGTISNNAVDSWQDY